VAVDGGHARILACLGAFRSAPEDFGCELRELARLAQRRLQIVAADVEQTVVGLVLEVQQTFQ
jgi:hypothetical protein